MYYSIMNPIKVLHGGVASTLADTVAIFGCAFTYKNPNLSTVSLDVLILEAVNTGIITAKCRIFSKEKNVSIWKVDMINEPTGLFAKATVTYEIST